MLRLEVAGFDEVLDAVKGFPGKLSPLLKRAVKSAMQPVLKAAKALCPRPKKRPKEGEVGDYGRTGLLKKSLGLKVGVVGRPGGKSPAGKGSIIGMVGPRKSVVGSARKGNKIVKVWPVKYAHLAEFGHKGFGGRRIPGALFLTRALQQQGSQVKSRLIQGLRDAIAKAAERRARRGKP